MTNPRIPPGTRSDIGWINWIIAAIAGRVAGTAPPNLFLTLARHRKLFRGWLRFAGRLMPRGTLMSTNLGMVVWVLFLGGLVWANFATRRTFDEACASGSPKEIERATCRYGTVLQASDSSRTSPKESSRRIEGSAKRPGLHDVYSDTS